MRAYLTFDDQLILRDATGADAPAVWRALHAIYLDRRGPDPSAPAGEPVPATTHLDVIEVVSAFEGLAGSVRRTAVHALAEWRRAYARTFELIAAAPDRRAVFPWNDVVWLQLTRPLAERLAISPAPPPTWVAIDP